VLLLKGHGSGHPVECVAFAPDGMSLASCSLWDVTLRLWDLRTGEHRVFDGRGARAAAFAPDGRLLLLAGVYPWDLWDVFKGQIVAPRAVTGGGRGQMRVSPDGRLLAMANRRVHLWDLVAGKLRPAWREKHDAASACLAFAPDGKTLAVGYTLWRVQPTYQHAYAVKLREVPGGREVQRLGSPTFEPTSVAFAPDGRALAAACGKYLWVWELPGGRPLVSCKPGRTHLRAVAFTPDGRFLAVAGNDQTVTFWDARTWKEHRAFDWKIGPLTDLAISPDGMRAAAASRRGKIVVWDLDDL
jgi:WD40 repeat protein